MTELVLLGGAALGVYILVRMGRANRVRKAAGRPGSAAAIAAAAGERLDREQGDQQ
jgi:uncharacterized membrane protein YebE (DUF533 family)